MNIPEKMNKSIAQKIKESVMLKIITILFLCLLLMIPVASVQSLIRERSGLKNQIENDVAKAYGQSQNIVPPVLKIPYSRTISDDDDKKKITNGFITVTPDMVEIDGDINTDKRKRSIYEVIVYKSALNLKGKILLPNLEKHEIDEYKFDYAGAYISIGLSDNNGLYEDLFITINGESFELSPGLIQDPLMITSLSTDALGIEDEHSLNFEMNLKVKGTRSIKFAPVARNAQVNLKSEWHSPSFIGSSLPQSYDITEEGFNSKWTTNQYNRDFPHYWFDGHYDFKKINKSFGVSLIEPIDGYGKNNRSSKYALLIIALTFGIFFFFEIMYKKNIHPIQYTMVGFSLATFYLLLLSLTEHIGFNSAYALSSIGTIILIVSYTFFIIKSKKAIIILLLLMSALFSYIFIILQLEEFALLAGSVGLFVILGSVMFLSRNIDWYNLNGSSIGE